MIEHSSRTFAIHVAAATAVFALALAIVLSFFNNSNLNCKNRQHSRIAVKKKIKQKTQKYRKPPKKMKHINHTMETHSHI